MSIKPKPTAADEISTRVTALEHDLQNVNTSLTALRTETKESFDKMARAQEASLERVVGLFERSRLSNDEETRNLHRLNREVNDRLNSRGRVDWHLVLGGAALLVAIIGLVGTGLGLYAHALITPLRTEMQLNDSLSIYQARYGSIPEDQRISHGAQRTAGN